MIYKILNKLFGWDFVYWKNIATEGISRVRTDYYGEPYYIWAINSRVRIITKSQVMWLTCKADKYLKDQGDE